MAPFIPAPVSVVRAALEAAWAGPCDIVYDLGAGDGRVVVIAARDYCVARAVGVEIDPVLAEAARAYARIYGVADRVEIREEDFFETSLEDATIVYLYLYASLNERLRPRLEEQLRPGARVVTIDFPVPGWTPLYVRRIRDEADLPRAIHVYVIGVSDTRHTRRGARVPGLTRQLEALALCRPGCPPSGAERGGARERGR